MAQTAKKSSPSSSHSQKPTTSRITFITSLENREALEGVAQREDRNLSYIINEALNNYLSYQRGYLKQVDAGIADADAGRFASEDEVEAFFGKYLNTSDEEPLQNQTTS